MAQVGFMGLGNMGLPMAGCLLRAGHAVRGFDLDPARRSLAEAAGILWSASAPEAAEGAEVVLTMLPAGDNLLDAYRGGLLDAARPGALLLDCSTVDVRAARDAHALALAAGHSPLDAPVSGGTAGAEAGTLTFMVGGDADAFARARPLLAAMGRRVVHCGGPGAGQAAKLCNNMILGASMLVVGEAFVLAEALGLDAQALFDVASTSSGQCWSLSTYCPVPGPVPASPANHGYRPGFAAGLMRKDLRLAREAAQAAGVDASLGAHAAAVFEAFCEAGHAGEDFSAVVRDVRARSARPPASAPAPSDPPRP